MRFLLDSHSLLWALGEPEKLSPKTRKVIEQSANRILVSTVTLWELSIKVNIGKLDIPEHFFEELEPAGFEILQFKQEHLVEYRKLPLKDHRDPFDRLLVSQAIYEQLTLVTKDEQLNQYSVSLLPA